MPLGLPPLYLLFLFYFIFVDTHRSKPHAHTADSKAQESRSGRIFAASPNPPGLHALIRLRFALPPCPTPHKFATLESGYACTARRPTRAATYPMSCFMFYSKTTWYGTVQLITFTHRAETTWREISEGRLSSLQSEHMSWSRRLLPRRIQHSACCASPCPVFSPHPSPFITRPVTLRTPCVYNSTDMPCSALPTFIPCAEPHRSLIYIPP